MALNALVDSFCYNHKKCGNERVKYSMIHDTMNEKNSVYSPLIPP